MHKPQPPRTVLGPAETQQRKLGVEQPERPLVGTAQRQVGQIAYAQGNAVAFGGKAAAGQFQHAGRAVHADPDRGAPA